MLNSIQRIPDQKVPLRGQTITLKATREETNGSCFIMETVVDPNGRIPFHIDREVEEFFYVVDGSMTVYVGDETFFAKPGNVIHFPKNVRHAFENSNNIPAKALIVQLPAGKTEDFFKLMGALPKEEPLSTEELCNISSECGTDLLETITKKTFSVK